MYPDLDEATEAKIVDSLCLDYLGFGAIQPLMDDPQITEIMINGPYKIYIEKNGRKMTSDIKFESEQHLR